MDLLGARRRYDVDKDGYLNKEEYKRYLMGIGCFWHNDSSCCDSESWHKAFVRYSLSLSCRPLASALFSIVQYSMYWVSRAHQSIDD